ncbi:MAG: hypothetical protein OEZ37_11980, partial [Gemmatimonadota bacterium]|nr:hypothetical protein [Gemmatimonadota bacterium]
GPDGTSWATWTLGDVPGTNGALASAAGLEGAFNVEAGCLDGYGTATPDGVMGATEWICAHSMPFVANISGGSTDAEAYWMNDGSNLYFAVRVRQSTYDRSNSLRVDFDNDGDGIHEAGDDAIGFDADGGTFFDQYLTEKCSNSGQSGCGAADGSVDGAGASANDGTWTVYELSHPLAAGDPRDFFLSSGDPFGFFLTLRVGKGAQGNTQVPGFRDFMQTTVAGH